MNVLTNSMQQSPSGEDDRSSVSQEIPCILWNLRLHYCVHDSLPPFPILSQINLFHARSPIQLLEDPL